jgi:ribokinase
VDTTGAGDTFCGVLAALLLAGRPLAPAVGAAQRAAALAVSRPGAFAALPGAAELTALLA